MSTREIRRVPPDWDHPRDTRGNYIPLFYGEGEEEIRMPRWDRKTIVLHYQLYETMSIGTPVSPVVESQEELAEWMLENESSEEIRSYDDWLKVIKSGSISNLVFESKLITRFALDSHTQEERELKFHDINADNYHHYAKRTDAESYEDPIGRFDEKTARLTHAAFGLVTEAAEFADPVKKYVYYGKGMDLNHMREELGDMIWYMAIAAMELGVDIHKLMFDNICKLKKRYPEKFTSERAIARADQEPFV